MAVDEVGGRSANSLSHAAATEEEDAALGITPLHIALWNGNSLQIVDGLNAHSRALEARDPRGHRALHLALKFAHRNSKNIVQRLLDAGARVRSRDSAGWKTIHHAIASENEDILRMLVQKEKEQTPILLRKKISDTAAKLMQVPDFYCEISVDVATWIPGVSCWLPTDTIKIWKRGEDLRFDMTLVGFDKTGWQRGDVSFLLLGGTSRFLCLDNKDKSSTNLLAPGKAMTKEDLDSMVHFLMTTAMGTTTMNASALEINRRRSWLLKSDVFESIGSWSKCAVYDMTGAEVILRRRGAQKKSRGGPQDAQPSTTRDALAAITEVADKAVVDVTVEPKADHVVSVELATNETLEWWFQVVTKDIDFSISFLPDIDDGTQTIQEVLPRKRYDVNSTSHKGFFTTPSSGTIVLKWDNTYSRFRSKDIRFKLSVDAHNPEAASASGWDAHRVKEKLTTFKDWFGVSIDELPEALRELRPKPSIMVYVAPEHHSISKTFSATVYASDAFPLTVEQFMPIIEVLSKTSSAFENTREFFSTELGGGFPVQFCFPLVPSISATLRFDCVELCTPQKSLFTVPDNYTQYHEDMLSPRTHQEMLQNLTAI